MVPTIPVSVWDQIAIVVIFALLLAGLGCVLVKLFVTAIADVNKHYADVLTKTNDQWQKYFDARSESNNLVNRQIMQQMGEISGLLSNLMKDFTAHDHMERQALDAMAKRREHLSKE